MPVIYDFTCPEGHTFEDFLSMEERDASVEERGVIATKCPTCGALAPKDTLQQTRRHNLQWKRAAHGQTTD